LQTLPVMPAGLQEQIAIASANASNARAGMPGGGGGSGGTGGGEEDRGKRWMKPKGTSPEKQDLKSVIEKRIGAMRKFLDEEQDHTVTCTGDFTEGGHSFF